MTYSAKELALLQRNPEAIEWRIKRRKSGLKLTQVAHMLDLSTDHIGKIERGLCPASETTRKQLSLLYQRWEGVLAKQAELRAQVLALRSRFTDV